jgi:hypothetical protein
MSNDGREQASVFPRLEESSVLVFEKVDVLILIMFSRNAVFTHILYIFPAGLHP